MVSQTSGGSAQSPRVRAVPNLPKATLVERRDITDDLFVIKLEPEQGPLNFKPGQYCTLGLEGIERAYSIVSSPHETLLEIFVELVLEGELTPRMHRMNIGDQMTIRPRAKGLFVLNQKVHHHFMVSTVTGVAPSVSMIRKYINDGLGDHKFYVLMGASYHDEFVYDKELAEYAAKYPEHIHFIPTVSRPNEDKNANWEGAKGRANAIAEEYMEKYNLPNDDTMVYACGHPGMISDVKDRVTAKGWQFIEERFWKE